jgi:hypothetical protein
MWFLDPKFNQVSVSYDQVSLNIIFKLRQELEHAPTHRHVYCSTGPCLSVKTGSEGATCLVASDPASLIGGALVLPCVL